MQLTLLASLAVLCTSAFAAPVDSRSPQLLDVIAYVENVLNDADVNVLTKRDELADIIKYVEDVGNDATSGNSPITTACMLEGSEQSCTIPTGW
ncbi:hypothetical protein EV424DRAFT_1547281 [Suillus variegatus]|nr:hypothetical protein EV424DRAFT_1547281 [Suillus variegatus]